MQEFAAGFCLECPGGRRFGPQYLARLGAALGSRSLIVYRGRSNCVSLLLALAQLRAGGGFMPLDASAPESWRQGWPQALQPVQEIDDLPSMAVAEVPPRAGGRLLIATSGTSGRPRLVELNADNLLAAAWASASAVDLQAGDGWLNCLPGCHISSQIIGVRCALRGARMAVQQGFVPTEVLRALNSGRITHVSLVPTQLRRLLELAPKRPLHARLRVILLGGAAADDELLQRALQRGWPLFVGYGATETGAMVAGARVSSQLLAATPLQPFADVELALDERQHIRLRAPSLARRAWAQQGVVGLLDEDGWLSTNDMGQLQDEGLRVLGRADQIINSGGKKIHPQPIERALLDCPGVEDLAVLGLPDRDWGQRLVVLYRGTARPDQLAAWAGRHLQGAYRPKQYLRVSSLARNFKGQLNRLQLGDKVAGQLSDGLASP